MQRTTTQQAVVSYFSRPSRMHSFGTAPSLGKRKSPASQPRFNWTS